MTENDTRQGPGAGQEHDRGVSMPEPGPDRVSGPSDPEAGMATAEYAIATVAAVGFAGLLLLVLQSDTVRGMLEAIIGSALSV